MLLLATTQLVSGMGGGQQQGQAGQQAAGQTGQRGQQGRPSMQCNQRAIQRMQRVCGDTLPDVYAEGCAPVYMDFWEECGDTIASSLHGGQGQGPSGGCPDGESDDTESCQECGDGIDNDGDGQSDCDDPDCASNPRECGQQGQAGQRGAGQAGQHGGRRMLMGGGQQQGQAGQQAAGQAGQRGQQGKPAMPSVDDMTRFYTACQAVDTTAQTVECSIA